jgi:hypothetical protein
MKQGAHLAGLLTVVVLIAAVGVGIIAVLVLHALRRPEVVRRGAEDLRRHPVWSFVIGLLVVLICLGFVALLQVLPEPFQGVFGLLMLLISGYLLFSGLAMQAHLLGDRILSSLNSRQLGSVFASVTAGGGLLVLLSYAAFVGQLLQVLVLIQGLGAALRVRLFRKRYREPVHAETGQLPAPSSAPAESAPPPPDAVGKSEA